MTGAFSYQPALLARRLTFTVTPTGLTCRTAEGDEKWRLDWAQVTAAAFVEHRVRGNLFRRLDLLTGASGGRQSVSITCGRVAPAADPDSAAHLGLVAAILDQLAARAGGPKGLCLIPEGMGSNAAETRWRAAPLFDPTGAMDSTLMRWEIIKNKEGTIRAWHVRWTPETGGLHVVSPVAERPGSQDAPG